jgi:cytochrome c7-like protein/class III cytochrome C family protein
MSRPLRLAVMTLGTAAAWVLLLPRAPLGQPIAFNHARHASMACPVCHRGAFEQARAGIPEAAVCLKCHATAPRAAAAVKWEELGRAQPIAWVRVSHLPEHAMFSHRRHVGLARLECTSCHGDVGTSAVPPGRPPMRLDMDACLACHRREGANQDCAGCHR